MSRTVRLGGRAGAEVAVSAAELAGAGEYVVEYPPGALLRLVGLRWVQPTRAMVSNVILTPLRT